MFAQLAALVLLSVSTVRATPLPTGLSRRTSSSHSYPSLSYWGGHQSLGHFDDFYGSGHFDVSSVHQTIIQEEHTVCRSVDIEIIQQRLVVIQEMAKRIITEIVCEVETQTIVLEQFHSSIGSFHNDISREGGRRLGYNSHIAGLYSQLVHDDGSLNLEDFGFSGSDLGSIVVPTGTNWNDNSSPDSISRALGAAQSAESSSVVPPQGVDSSVIPPDNTAIPVAAAAPADGDNTAIPTAAAAPADGDNTAIPTAAAAPADGDNTAIPTAAAAPADGDNTAIPTAAAAPADGDNTAIPSPAAA